MAKIAYFWLPKRLQDTAEVYHALLQHAKSFLAAEIGLLRLKTERQGGEVVQCLEALQALGPADQAALPPQVATKACFCS